MRNREMDRAVNWDGLGSGHLQDGCLLSSGKGLTCYFKEGDSGAHLF